MNLYSLLNKLTALSIAGECEVGTPDQLIVSLLSAFEILLGKIVPLLTIAMVLKTVMPLVVILGFKVPERNDI